MTGPPRFERVPPRAESLVESLRDIGYTFPAAVADVVDNSITARATEIEILDNSDPDYPAIGILDNGHGMTEPELTEAMRLGTRSPTDKRKRFDLGRFGLGMKTAAFSQCRRLTVVTRRDDTVAARRWDLDTVVENADWTLETLPDPSAIPFFDRLDSDGTVVVWEKLDRLGGTLTDSLDRTASHLELVFHRILSAEVAGRHPLRISINGRPLEPFDPFHSSHAATQRHTSESFQLAGHRIRIQPFTLPHHQKVTRTEWEKYAGDGGYLKNQGFYIYREKRLIIHGTWFRLAPQAELTKLARIRIDIPNALDSHWKIDIKKGSAQLPSRVRDRLRRIVDQFCHGSKRTYTSRGPRLTDDVRLPVWIRTQNKNQITYSVNPEHPAIDHFDRTLPADLRRSLRIVLNLISNTLPFDALHADLNGSPQDLGPADLADVDRHAAIALTCRGLRDQGFSLADARTTLMAALSAQFSVLEAGAWEARLVEILRKTYPDAPDTAS